MGSLRSAGLGRGAARRVRPARPSVRARGALLDVVDAVAATPGAMARTARRGDGRATLSLPLGALRLQYAPWRPARRPLPGAVLRGGRRGRAGAVRGGSRRRRACPWDSRTSRSRGASGTCGRRGPSSISCSVLSAAFCCSTSTTCTASSRTSDATSASFSLRTRWNLARAIHVSGGSWAEPRHGRIRQDTHDDAVPDEVFALVAEAIARCPNVEAVVFERLGGTVRDEPDAARLRADYERLRRVVREASTTQGARATDPRRHRRSTRSLRRRMGRMPSRRTKRRCSKRSVRVRNRRRDSRPSSPTGATSPATTSPACSRSRAHCEFVYGERSGGVMTSESRARADARSAPDVHGDGGVHARREAGGRRRGRRREQRRSVRQA